MNQSQLVLRELSNDPERAIKFLKNLKILISIQKRNWSRGLILYFLGILSGMVVYDAVLVWMPILLKK